MKARNWLILLVALAGAFGVWTWLGRDYGGKGKQNGLVVLPIRTFALNLNPAEMSDIDSRKVATLIYVGLVAVDQNGSVSPRLAVSWRRIDGNGMEFKLRPNVTFPDGTPVTAQAVTKSLCASMQPAHVQSWSLASISHRPGKDGAIECTGLEAPDAATVIVREERPTPWLLEMLAGPGGWIVDVTKKPAAYGVRPGIGPYVVSRIAPDSRIELTARSGGAIAANAQRIEFRYIADTAAAAGQFNAGQLDFIEIDQPQLAELVLTPNGKPKLTGASVVRGAADRVRVVGFNLQHLRKLGLSEAGVRTFIAAYSGNVARAQIVARSLGLAQPLQTPFPPAGKSSDQPSPASVNGTPASGELVLLAESDPYSDAIAAQLPTSIGGVRIRYQTVDKSVLIQALLKGNFDAALIKVEATHHVPKFWAAFFTPGNPYAAFGTPIAGLEDIDLSTAEGIKKAADLVTERGNWVPVIRDVGVFVTSPKVAGIRLTESGQLSFEEIGPRK